jgi:V8-like Glu-specific endopeptidase
MYRDTWNNCHSSICSINFLNQQGIRIASGTGFKVSSYLVTNNHVFNATGAINVELKFVNEDGHTALASKVISYLEFQNRLQIGMPENSWDYAILNLNDNEFRTIPSLTLADSNTIQIGQKVAVLGYQFDQNNLSIKQGILSSRHTRAGVKYLQIDASVNQGNSGGPLINIDNNRVVGIVTRKHTGLTNAFDDLLKSFATNIKALQVSNQGRSVRISGIDPVEVLIISQNQMKSTAEELRRSANVGIGYAFELDEIKNFFDNQ